MSSDKLDTGPLKMPGEDKVAIAINTLVEQSKAATDAALALADEVKTFNARVEVLHERFELLEKRIDENTIKPLTRKPRANDKTM